jgi:NTP pyrophosphatase (non-canonical NTP hydrolase)
MLNELSQKIFQANKEKGFWDNERNVGEMLMLVTTELAEAMESHRKGKFCQLETFNDLLKDAEFKQAFEKNIKDTFSDEMADSLIRILDMCGGLDIDIKKHVELKLRYNSLRPKLHGKLY